MTRCMASYQIIWKHFSTFPLHRMFFKEPPFNPFLSSPPYSSEARKWLLPQGAFIILAARRTTNVCNNEIPFPGRNWGEWIFFVLLQKLLYYLKARVWERTPHRPYMHSSSSPYTYEYFYSSASRMMTSSTRRCDGSNDTGAPKTCTMEWSAAQFTVPLQSSAKLWLYTL